MGRLFSLCVARSGCPHFGLLVGRQGGISSLGIVGLLSQHLPDVRTALRNIILHLHLHDRGAVPTLEVQNETAMLGYTIYQKNVVSTDQIYDGAMAIAFNLMKTLCGPRWLPSEVLLCHAEPADREPYRALFKVPPRFDAERTALVFPATWLDQPMHGVNPQLRRILEAEVEALKILSDGDFVSQLRRILQSLIVAGCPSVDQTALLLAMHRRTLNRRLNALGITFKQLLDETRFEIAQQLLRDTRMPVVDIAVTLNYTGASAFTRAFRRWSGASPAAWRAVFQRN
jgi:AraC-like DNA-binding protein